MIDLRVSHNTDDNDDNDDNDDGDDERMPEPKDGTFG